MYSCLCVRMKREVLADASREAKRLHERADKPTNKSIRRSAHTVVVVVVVVVVDMQCVNPRWPTVVLYKVSLILLILSWRRHIIQSGEEQSKRGQDGWGGRQFESLTCAANSSQLGEMPLSCQKANVIPLNDKGTKRERERPKEQDCKRLLGLEATLSESPALSVSTQTSPRSFNALWAQQSLFGAAETSVWRRETSEQRDTSMTDAGADESLLLHIYKYYVYESCYVALYVQHICIIQIEYYFVK